MTWPAESIAAQLSMTWADTSTNEDGFKIERRAGVSGTFAQIATLGAGVTSYTDTDSNLIAGSIYCYRVRAFNTSGDSAYSNQSCATALGTTIDTDGDGLTDGEEINIGTDPTLADTDGDGVSDGVEVSLGSNPLDPTSIAAHLNPYIWTD